MGGAGRKVAVRIQRTAGWAGSGTAFSLLPVSYLRSRAGCGLKPPGGAFPKPGWDSQVGPPPSVPRAGPAPWAESRQPGRSEGGESAETGAAREGRRRGSQAGARGRVGGGGAAAAGRARRRASSGLPGRRGPPGPIASSGRREEGAVQTKSGIWAGAAQPPPRDPHRCPPASACNVQRGKATAGAANLGRLAELREREGRAGGARPGRTRKPVPLRAPLVPSAPLRPGRPRAPAPGIHTFLRAFAFQSLGLAWGWGALLGRTPGTKGRKPSGT